jgi:hypothetical protein
MVARTVEIESRWRITSRCCSTRERRLERGSPPWKDARGWIRTAPTQRSKRLPPRRASEAIIEAMWASRSLGPTQSGTP